MVVFFARAQHALALSVQAAGWPECFRRGAAGWLWEGFDRYGGQPSAVFAAGGKRRRQAWAMQIRASQIRSIADTSGNRAGLRGLTKLLRGPTPRRPT